MLRVAHRLAKAEFQTRPLPLLLAGLAVACAVGLASLALGVAAAGGIGYERVIADSDGAHGWIFNDSPDLPAQLAAMPGVSEVSPRLRRAQATIIAGENTTLPVSLWAVPFEQPAPTPTLIQQGRWPQSALEGVIDSGLAARTGIELGDRVEISGTATTVQIVVVGFGISTTGAPYPFNRPAELFTSLEVVQSVSGGRFAASAIGVRLEDRNEAGGFFQAASERTGLSIGGITWLQIQKTIANTSRPAEILLGAFAVFAFLAAGFVLVNSVSAALLGKRRQIGLLRAAGLTPPQIVAIVVGQYAILATVSGVVGVAFGWLLTPLFAGRVATLLRAPRPPFDPVLAVLLVLLGIAAVVFYVLFPALNAARGTVNESLHGATVRTATRTPFLVKLAAAARMPVSLRVGGKDTFANPARAWMTIGAISLAIATIVLSLTLEATARAIADDPRIVGQPAYQLRLTPRGRIRGGYDRAAANLQSVDGVLTTMVERTQRGTLVADPPEPPPPTSATSPSPSETPAPTATPTPTVSREPFDFIGLSGDVDSMPFNVVDGRMATASGEALAGLGMVRDYGIALGQTLHVRGEDGREFIVSVTGIVPNASSDDRVILYRGLNAGGRASIVLRTDPGTKPAEVATEIERQFPGRFDIDNLAAAFEIDLKDQRDNLRAVLVSLDAALLVVALANLAGVMVLTVRERTREIGILQTLGFTRPQVFASIAIAAGVYAAAGTAIGAPSGYLITRGLFEHYGGEAGWPGGIAQVPPPTWFVGAGIVVFAVFCVLVSIPARMATRLEIRDALTADP
ncbi:MAG: ABC transporter permease [Dehalococcoidia bacterium]